MNHSGTITKIAPALLKSQKEIGAAKKGSTNPFFHSRYADLGSVMEACKEALNNNGITVLQPVVGMTVETVLLHDSGEWISSEYPVTPKLTKVTNKEGVITETISDPQATGSAISYARRYGLQSMVFIPSEDDDGNQASNPVKPNTGVYTVGNEVHVKEEDLGVCDKCGSPNALSSVGNKYCSAKCWLKK